jgi:sulfur-carrier protein adenylyltransferase/sulfurtransferase
MRYLRHLALPEVGAAGQARLARARVLVVGAGGLGSPAALYLAAAGVGTLGIVDADHVELSNLQRQILHDTPAVGEAKVSSAARRLHALNPEIRIEPHPVRLEPPHALDLVDGYDLVVDGSDNLATRYLVNDVCLSRGIPWVYGAVERWTGHVAVFAAPGGPCFRCLFREPPPPGAIPGCAEVGVVGALPGIIGAMQALEAIKWIVRDPTLEPLVGRLLVFDGARMTARHIHPARNPDCPACGPAGTRPFQAGEALWHAACSGQGAGGGPGRGPEDGPSADDGVEEIGPAELARRMAGTHPPRLLDVRERWEWEAGNLADLGASYVGPVPAQGARHLPPEVLALDRDVPIVLVCRAGGRSLSAGQVLREAGFSRVASLSGGLVRWAREQAPDLAVV